VKRDSLGHPIHWYNSRVTLERDHSNTSRLWSDSHQGWFWPGISENHRTIQRREGLLADRVHTNTLETPELPPNPIYYHWPIALNVLMSLVLIQILLKGCEAIRLYSLPWSGFQTVTTLWLRQEILRSPLRHILTPCPLVADHSAQRNSCSLSTVSMSLITIRTMARVYRNQLFPLVERPMTKSKDLI